MLEDDAVERGLAREAWLLGQPPLQDYIDYLSRALPQRAGLRGALVREWQAANDCYYELEQTEAALCDAIEIDPLPAELRPLQDAVERDARFEQTFDTVPTRFAMVQLDRLIVTQQHINLDHVERLKASLEGSRNRAAIFRFCLPLDRSEAAVRVRRLGSKRFLFSSHSADFRFHRPVILRPSDLSGYETFGPVSAIAGAVVGFGSNFLNVIQSDNRLVIHDGHHRAFALRDLGVTHAPCIIQTVTRRDELNLVATRRVAEAPAFYFQAARPPLLKDFFDPRIRKVLHVRPAQQLIEISLEIKEFEVFDFDGPD